MAYLLTMIFFPPALTTVVSVMSLRKVMSFIHRNTFDFMIAAIVLHITAIVYYWRFKKQNLVLPMITGKKAKHLISETDVIPHSKIMLAVIIAIACTAFYLLVGRYQCTSDRGVFITKSTISNKKALDEPNSSRAFN